MSDRGPVKFDEIVSALQNTLGESYAVETRVVQKFEGTVNGVVVRKRTELCDKSIGVVLYPEPVIMPAQLAEHVTGLAVTAKRYLKKVPNNWRDQFQNGPEWCVKNLSVILLNLKNAEHYLADKVYREYFDDLALLAVVRGDRYYSPLMLNQVKSLGFENAEEVLDRGLANFLSGGVCSKPLNEVLHEIAPEMDYPPSEWEGVPQFTIVTNETNFFGAPHMLNSMLLSKVSAEISKKADSPMFVIPSSVHEILCLSSECGISAKEFREIVQYVNLHHVIEEERLSDSVYLFRNGQLGRVIND